MVLERKGHWVPIPSLGLGTYAHTPAHTCPNTADLMSFLPPNFPALDSSSLLGSKQSTIDGAIRQPTNSAPSSSFIPRFMPRTNNVQSLMLIRSNIQDDFQC